MIRRDRQHECWCGRAFDVLSADTLVVFGQALHRFVSYRFDSTSVVRTVKPDSATSAGVRLNLFTGWYDSVIQAVDMTTGKSLGSQTLPFSGSSQLLRGGYLATLDGNTDGSVRIIIWSLTIPVTARSK